MTVTIYALRDPRDGKVSWVGASKQPSRQISKNFYKANRMGTPGPLYDFLRELTAHHLKPEIIPVEQAPKDQAKARIAHWQENLGWIQVQAKPYRPRDIVSTRTLLKSGYLKLDAHLESQDPTRYARPDHSRYHAQLRRDLDPYFPKSLPLSQSRRTGPAEIIPNSARIKLLPLVFDPSILTTKT